MIRLLVLLLLTFALNACNGDVNRDTSVDVIPDTVSEKSSGSARAFLDTIIKLGIPVTTKTKDAIAEPEAIGALHSYFRKKGVLPEEELKLNRDTSGTLAVSYDTLYQVKGRQFSGAVISYWLGPAGLSGHCFQPSRAIVVNTEQGYVVSNENFIGTNFSIDSTKGEHIYGFDYDCGGKGIVRKFRITLQQ